MAVHTSITSKVSLQQEHPGRDACHQDLTERNRHPRTEMGPTCLGPSLSQAKPQLPSRCIPRATSPAGTWTNASSQLAALPSPQDEVAGPHCRRHTGVSTLISLDTIGSSLGSVLV